jgi:hypothetical protein
VRLWLLLCAQIGCVQTATLVCEQGTEFERVCGAADRCDDAHHLCVTPDQITVCADQPTATPCMTAVTGSQAICRDGVCLPAICGDGIALGLEECDGDDLRNMTCQSLGYYAASPLSCKTDQTCTFDKSACLGYCGDNLVEPDIELCDGADPELACVDFGFGAGYLACNNFTCGPDLTDCKFLGWHAPNYAPDKLAAIDGTDDANVFAVGDHGLVRYWNGQSWRTIDTSGCDLANTYFKTVDVIGPSEAWVAGDDNTAIAGVAAYINGSTCTKTTLAPSITVTDISALGANDVWAAAANGTYHYDGQAWTRSDPSFASFSVYAAASNAVYVTAPGGSTIRKYDGSTWNTITPPSLTRHVRGVSATEIYFGTGVGNPAILRYDGSTFTPLPAITENSQVHSIAVAQGHVYIGMQDATGAPSARVFDGTSWARMGVEEVFTAMTSTRRNIYASPTGNLYVCGLDEAAITRFEGTDLIEHPSALAMVGQSFTSAFATSTGNAYVSRSDGAVYIYTGNTWTQDGNIALVRTVGLAASGEVLALTSNTSSSMRVRVASSGTWNAINTSAALKFWAAASNDIWLAATGTTPNVNTVRHWNGSTDTACATCDLGAQIAGLFGTATDDVYAWGFGTMFKRWNGSSWATVPNVPWTTAVRDMTGWARNDIVVATRTNGVFHFDGSTWTSMSFPVPNFQLDHVWGRSATDLFASNGFSDIFHYDGTHWSPVRINSLQQVAQVAIAGESVWLFDIGSNPMHQLIRTKPW